MKKMNKVILTVSLLGALSVSTMSEARDQIHGMTDPELTKKAIESQMQKPENVRVVNFDNMLLKENLGDIVVKESVPVKTKDIDLQTAVASAVNNNREIRLSELSLENAKATVSKVAATKNPSIGYSWKRVDHKAQIIPKTVGYILNKDKMEIEPVIKFINTGTHSYSQNLTLNWPIWTGGAVEGAIDAARYAEDIAHINIYQTEADIKLAAVKAYYQYLEMNNLADIAGESVKNLDGHMKNVQQQYNAGIVAKLDVLASNVSLANARKRSISAHNARDLAEANLNNIMRIPMDTKLNPREKTFPEPAFDITMEEAVAVGQKYRWELIKADYNVRIAKEQVRIAKAGYMPTVAVGGGYGWDTAGLGGFDKDKWNIYGAVNWSIWDGGATDAKIKGAKAGLKTAEEILLQAREKVELEIRQDYLSVFAAKEQIRAAEATVEQAEEAYKIATIRYQSGVGINLDVLDAQLALSQAKTNYVTALYDYNIGLATLEHAMGLPAVAYTEIMKK